MPRLPSRRDFHVLAAGGLSACLMPSGPGAKAAEPAADRPKLLGIASGDVSSDGAVIWSRVDRPARMVVEYASDEAFQTNVHKVMGPEALEVSDYTARVVLTDLPAGATIHYRVLFQDLRDGNLWSAPLRGQLRTPGGDRKSVTFVFGGDTAGQGWGINPEWGGYRIYDTMRQTHPDFLIHLGDHIYADNPILPEVKLADGTLWKNIVTEAKSRVAQTLDDYRGNYRYNWLDEPFRRFHAEVPLVAIWDDHEVLNNWFPGEKLDDPRYSETSVSLLAARGRRAFLEYMPIRPNPVDPERIYRVLHYGPALDLFMLDQRSYRGPNSANRQPVHGSPSYFHGPKQLAWLKESLRASRATWKVIGSDMPIGLVVSDTVNGQPAFENAANGDGPPLGRELEFADLFAFLKREKIRNVVWLTADVHYASANYYDPAKAQFQDFLPFWEFIAGPFHAGTFGPAKLDNTFGPQVKFHALPRGMRGNRPPSDGLQFFGKAAIAAESQILTVSLHNLAGQSLFSIDLHPERV